MTKVPPLPFESAYAAGLPRFGLQPTEADAEVTWAETRARTFL
jgi:hypothetical protein